MVEIDTLYKGLPRRSGNALQIISLAAYASETNKISKMKKICGCVIQEMVSISSALSINNTVIASDYCNSILTRCWRAMIWSIVDKDYTTLRQL